MDNREKLLDIALSLFSQRGYDAVGVQEIVDEAGVTKPTLYHYFDSKRGLLDALIQREEGRLLSGILFASIYQGDLIITLERIVKAYFKVSKEHPDFYRLQMGMVFAPPESEANQAIHPFISHQVEILEEVFIQAAVDHGNLHGRHKRYAAGLLGMINAMIGLYLNDELVLTNEIVYQSVHQFMYGIFS
jgi:TetR/AcrR family transcriptional regulator